MLTGARQEGTRAEEVDLVRERPPPPPSSDRPERGIFLVKRGGWCWGGQTESLSETGQVSGDFLYVPLGLLKSRPER